MMNKAILLSVRPEHLVNILNGYKTLELRKTVPKDFNGWVYIYVTKGKPYIRKLGENYFTECSVADVNKLNGKIVARFWFDEYIELEHYDFWEESYYWKNTVISAFALEKATCMSSLEMEEYAKGKTLYAWHIKKLEIFDKPMELSDFYFKGKIYYDFVELKRPPQSWRYVYEREEERKNDYSDTKKQDNREDN